MLFLQNKQSHFGACCFPLQYCENQNQIINQRLQKLQNSEVILLHRLELLSGWVGGKKLNLSSSNPCSDEQWSNPETQSKGLLLPTLTYWETQTEIHNCKIMNLCIFSFCIFNNNIRVPTLSILYLNISTALNLVYENCSNLVIPFADRAALLNLFVPYGIRTTLTMLTSSRGPMRSKGYFFTPHGCTKLSIVFV